MTRETQNGTVKENRDQNDESPNDEMQSDANVKEQFVDGRRGSCSLMMSPGGANATLAGNHFPYTRK